MPIENVLVLAAIVLTFAVFAAVVAWGDFQTRRAHKELSSGAKQQ